MVIQNHEQPPGLTIRIAGLLPLLIGIGMNVVVADRSRLLQSQMPIWGVREAPWLTQTLLGIYDAGGCWVLAGVLVVASAHYWVRASRHYSSLAWFQIGLSILLVAGTVFAAAALQQPQQQVVDGITGASPALRP